MRNSLRWRLPLLISLLIGIVLIVFLWAAYGTVHRTLVRGGFGRAQAAASQIARLLDASRTPKVLQQLAIDPDLRQFLQTRTGDARDAAHTRLAALAATGPREVALWDRNGTQLLVVSKAGANGRSLPAPTLSVSHPPKPGLGPLQASDGVVFYDLVADIAGDAPPTGTAGSAPPLGYLIIRATLTVTPPGIIKRLVGPDADVSVGDRTSGVWTDFSGVAPAPPIDQIRGGVAKYRRADGDLRIGALVPIRGSSLATWVDLSYASVVAPARGFLNSMIFVALVCVLLGAVLAGIVSARLSRPIIALSETADAIAAGNFAPRVSIKRRDEIGRLGAAFNAMADEVEASQERLEARVAERTAELAAARLEAERANRAKSAFLSGMSHDLRTPLNAILGFAQLLELDAADTDRAESVRQILSGGRHLLELITQVLDITRIESGQLALSSEPVSVRDVVQPVVELVGPLAKQRDITITIRPIPPDDTVRADRQRLNQVLLNLLSNAVKYNREHGQIVVGIERVPANRYRITVRDSGAGIPHSKLQLLFQPFERLGAEQTAIEGTGLGLALSRALAEAMGGSIGVQSVVDEGSTFWVELAEIEPQEERAPAPVAVDAGALREASGKGLVLYIEDNTSNVRLMERILRQRPGVELLHAPDAEAGFTAVAERRPDLVLLDLHLPGLSGEETLQRLWADPASRPVPVVVVTADATPGLARRLKAAGATACITKPLNVKEVLQLVDSLLNASVTVPPLNRSPRVDEDA